MDARREYTTALVGLAGGGALALAVTQAGWVVARTSDVGFDTTFRGTEVAAPVVACGLVAMAGAVGLLATRRSVRRLVGGVLALVGVVVTVIAVRVLVDPSSAVLHPLSQVTGGASAATVHIVSLAWWWCLLAAAGGLTVAAAGILTVVRSGRWAVMGTRYDGPAGGRRVATPDAWTRLDRGEDPTVDPGPATASPDLQQ